MKTQRLYNAAEAAEQIGCSAASVLNWCAKGYYQHVQVGKRGVGLTENTVRQMRADYVAWKIDVLDRKRQAEKQRKAKRR